VLEGHGLYKLVNRLKLLKLMSSQVNCRN